MEDIIALWRRLEHFSYRKAEVRHIARETSSMMLERLVKEGLRGLDKLLAGMIREGNTDPRDGIRALSEGGELNGALVRYLEEAIRLQESTSEEGPTNKISTLWLEVWLT